MLQVYNNKAEMDFAQGRDIMVYHQGLEMNIFQQQNPQYTPLHKSVMQSTKHFELIGRATESDVRIGRCHMYR